MVFTNHSEFALDTLCQFSPTLTPFLVVPMVFTIPAGDKTQLGTGLILERNTGGYTTLLIIEALVGMVVVLSNAFVIVILILGWRRLMKNHFYIIVANLVVFTSLKAVVEMVFILPYYIVRDDGQKRPFGVFSDNTELFFFNLSVLADYGVLFFSLVIAVNRYMSVAIAVDTRDSKPPVMKTLISCISAWISSAVIPLLFFFCGCQYEYSENLKLYYNNCEVQIEWIKIVMNILINLTYACAVVVLLLYIRIFIFLRGQRKKHPSVDKSTTHRTSVQMKLLRQSLVVFILYACSMLSVLILSFIDPGKEGMFDLAYAENLLNLSIAAVYPICFVAMSGEMKNILISKLTQTMSSGRVASVSLNNNGNVAPSR